MNPLKTIFKNIKAFGDVVGRDKIINNILPRPRQIDLLSESLKNEIENNEITTIIIDELTHYRNKRSEIKDLTHKLTEAGYNNLIEEAEELKELIAKLIVKNQNYKSAQKIITLLLSETQSIFNAKIKPKLDPDLSECKIKEMFRDYLEQEIKDQLGKNVLEIYNRQINGMVFFLTGNCHLEWK